MAGEGEYVMPEIAQYFEGKKALSEILGIAYRQDGEVKVNSAKRLSSRTWMSFPTQPTT